MKKFFNTLFVIIAAMVTFAACIKEENAPASEIKTVQFFAESIETKTHFGDKNDEGKYPTLWDNGDRVKILLNLEQPTGVSGLERTVVAEISDDFKSARFEAEINSEYEFADYTFYAVVPADRYNAKNSAEGRFTVQIPSDQTPQANSVDKDAQVLYAISETTNSFPERIQLDFKHFTAYGKLSLKNLTEAISTISSITLEFDGVSLAGKWNYQVADGSVNAKEGRAKLVLTTSATENIWFACAPVDVSGKDLTLIVNTDKGPLKKTVKFPENREFEAGKISTFAIDMSGIEPTVSETEWISTSFADLKDGDQVVIVSTKGTSIYAMSNNKGTGAAPVATAITYSNNKLSEDPEETIIWYVGVENTARTFYASSDKWLYCTDTNNGVRVGTNDAKTFVLDNASGYLKHEGTSRYVGIYNNQDWRCYETVNNNIKGQTFQFFVKKVSSEGGESPEDPIEPEEPVEPEEPIEPEEPVTITKSISEYGFANEQQVTTIALDGVISATVSGGGNTGKYYTNGSNWRLYQTENASLTILAKTGYTIRSVKVTYTVTNTGTLKKGALTLASGTEDEVNASSVTYTVGNTKTATNGQVRITAIEVVYQAD